MSNQQRGKKKIKSSKELHYQEKYEGKSKKEIEKIQNQQQCEFNKLTKEELLQQLPNRLLNSIQQQFKKIEQPNLKLTQISKDISPPDLNLSTMLNSFHQNIFTQYCTYQSNQNQQLCEFIRGSQEKQYQLKQLAPIIFENPLNSRIQQLEQIAAQNQ